MSVGILIKIPEEFCSHLICNRNSWNHIEKFVISTLPEFSLITWHDDCLKLKIDTGTLIQILQELCRHLICRGILEIIHWKVRHLNLARIFFDCMTWSSPFSWFFFIQQLYSYYSHHSLELAPHSDLKLRNSFVNCKDNALVVPFHGITSQYS